MKASQSLVVSLLIILSLAFSSNVHAQFDEFAEEEIVEEEADCIPETLTTAYDKVTKENLTQPIPLIFNFGFEYYKNKSYKEAMPYLWKVFIFDSSKYARNAIRYISRMYFDQGMVDSTLLACYRGLEKFPNIITLHYYAGILQQKIGKPGCAIPHYEAQIERDSTNVSNLKTLAFLYYSKENEESIELQKKVVELSPDDPEAVTTLAQYTEHFYGGGAGYEFFKTAYMNDPDNLDYSQSFGRAAASAGHYQEAVEPFTKIINEKPSKNAYEQRADVYENLQQHSNAIDDYKKIIELDPDNAEIMIKIAKNYKLQNQFSNARYWINKALQAKRNFGLAYITMGEIYEAAVSYCQRQRGGEDKYQDKMVYELAFEEYEKAQSDPAYVSKARSKQNYVKPLMPTTEDKFMHQNDKISDEPCYSWIN